jgi:hypothetical protein
MRAVVEKALNNTVNDEDLEHLSEEAINMVIREILVESEDERTLKILNIPITRTGIFAHHTDLIGMFEQLLQAAGLGSRK